MVGGKIDDLLHLLVGRAAALVPLLLLAVGALVFIDSPLRHLRPLRLGVAVGFASLTLAVSSTDTRILSTTAG